MTNPHVNLGVFFVALVGLGLMLALVVADIIFMRTYMQPVGRWIEAWARRFPVIAFLLAAVLGMLIGHFYWSIPAPCPVGAHGEVLADGTDKDCVPPRATPPPDT
jgi:Zn-dependent protease